MVFETAVKDKIVGKRGKDKVQRGGAKAGDKQNRRRLPADIIARQRRDDTCLCGRRSRDVLDGGVERVGPHG